ncbi:MAG: hypothetical protein BJ554DRAFT_7522, partial [Olpidium bornovanus]
RGDYRSEGNIGTSFATVSTTLCNIRLEGQSRTPFLMLLGSSFPKSKRSIDSCLKSFCVERRRSLQSTV